MPTAQDSIKATVSSLHQRHLKKLGFRKTANTWIRATTWPQVINLQLSQWNSADEAKITVNLGVSIEPLHHAAEGLPLKGSLKEYDCDIRARIGTLLPDQRDKWWTITPSTNADQLADEIFEDVSTHGLPWFGRLVTYGAVADELAANNHLWKAALAYSLDGNHSEAEKRMVEAFSGANQLAVPKLKRLAKLYSISMSGGTRR
jgi:hypothetical protein